MNVRELIEELSCYPDDMDVHFAYDYGDRCHHECAVRVEEVETGTVQYSYYTQTDCLVDEDEDEDEEVREVVVLKS